jgi:mRNA interferase RelE/StbE
MVKYTIKIDRVALKALASMPKKVQRQIRDKIDGLAEKPFPPNCLLIKNSNDIYRIKSGSYRIAYKVEGKRLIILVVRIGHRKDFYNYFDK